MTDSLHAIASSLAGVRPTLDEAGSITALNVDINLSYADVNNTPVVGRTVSFNAWDVLSETQKTNMQDIQQTLLQHIVETYFA